jgi:hypothetical protein
MLLMATPPGAVYLHHGSGRNAVGSAMASNGLVSFSQVKGIDGLEPPNRKERAMLAAIGGLGIVGIIVVVLIVLAVLYFARRA